MMPSTHREVQQLICKILKYYGFTCKMEYEVRNNQRIDVVAGLDKEVEVAVEVEFSRGSFDPIRGEQRF